MGRYANVNLSNLAFMNKASLEGKIQAFKTTHIEIDKIIPNERNEYSLQDIEELKFSILHNGLKQNLEVYLIGEGLYKLVSGERRFTALKALVQEGHNEFSSVPCLVTDFSQNKLPLSEASKEMYAIITTNSEAREFTDADRMFQVRELKKIYTELQQNGVKLTGKMDDLIAADLNISKTQVGRYNFVESHGVEELKKKVDTGEISIRAADSVAHLSPAKQKAMLQEGEITSTTAQKEIKKVAKKKAIRKDSELKKSGNINLYESSFNNYYLPNFISKLDAIRNKSNASILDQEKYELLEIKAKSLDRILDNIMSLLVL